MTVRLLTRRLCRCSEEALPKIAQQGFLRSKQTSAAGAWQRFGGRRQTPFRCSAFVRPRQRILSRVGWGAGPGFYFALQASKSHEYPPREMQALPPGTHSRSMLLCKVAKGKVFRSERNMDTLTQPPDGFHSVLGVATEEGEEGDLNYDELVVYDEAAILPCVPHSVPPMLGGAPVPPCPPALSLAKFVLFCVRFVLELSVGFCPAGSGRLSPPHGSRVAAAAGSR